MEERQSKDSQGRQSSQHCADAGRPSYATESVLNTVEEKEPEQKNGASSRWRARNRDKNTKGLLHRFAKVRKRPTRLSKDAVIDC